MKKSKDKIINLLKSGDPTNIDLALMLMESQDITLPSWFCKWMLDWIVKERMHGTSFHWESQISNDDILKSYVTIIKYDYPDWIVMGLHESAYTLKQFMRTLTDG